MSDADLARLGVLHTLMMMLLARFTPEDAVQFQLPDRSGLSPEEYKAEMQTLALKHGLNMGASWVLAYLQTRPVVLLIPVVLNTFPLCLPGSSPSLSPSLSLCLSDKILSSVPLGLLAFVVPSLSSPPPFLTSSCEPLVPFP